MALVAGDGGVDFEGPAFDAAGEAPDAGVAFLAEEEGGFGAAHAAPIARRVFDYVLLGRYPNEEDLLAVQKGLAGSPIRFMNTTTGHRPVKDAWIR